MEIIRVIVSYTNLLRQNSVQSCVQK